MTRRDIVRAVDSYASLLVLLLANFFVIELVTDARWGAVASILLAVAALIVAISDPDAGQGLETWHWILIGVCVAIAPVVLLVTSSSVLGVAYLVPVGLLVSAFFAAASAFVDTRPNLGPWLIRRRRKLRGAVLLVMAVSIVVFSSWLAKRLGGSS